MKTLGKLALLVLVVTVSAAGNAQDVLIRGAKIVSDKPAEQMSEQDILIKDGKIQAIGDKLSIADGTQVIEADGAYLTAGLFNAETRLGVVEIGAVAETRDYASSNSRITAALKVHDAINPSSVTIPHNRSLGVTHALVQPSSDAGLFAGTASIINLTGSVDKTLVKSNVAMVMQFGQDAAELVGGSRSAALAHIREAFDDAIDYRANKASYNQGQRRDYYYSRQDLAALGPVVAGRMPLLVHVDRASDIRSILALAKRYRLKLILSGVSEGWLVAKEIAERDVPVILDPIYNLPASYEAIGTRLDNAKLLHEAGVTLLFTGMGWQNTHNAFLVRQSAGNAVSNGLPYAAALAAMTSNPAKVFGLRNQGTVVVGNKANLVLWSGDPLELLSSVKAVLIDGKSYPLQSRATRLRDRYWQKYQNQ